MKILKTPQACQVWRQSIDKQSLGFVPTMGNLHDGHLQLFNRSVKENEITAVSIFVNPTQFNNQNDFDNYPKTFAEDLEKAASVGVDVIFAPEYEAMYPDNYRYKLSENDLSTVLEGEHRPGHFEGVLTVVMKLLQLVRPQRAYFGEKDYQQYRLIKDMAEAFFLDIDVIGCETVRLKTGLPLSSRNTRLTSEQLKTASLFPKYFHANLSCDQIRNELESAGVKVEYIEDHDGRRFGAVWIGDVRLLDNVVL